jgi:hypothetical protein
MELNVSFLERKTALDKPCILSQNPILGAVPEQYSPSTQHPRQEQNLQGIAIFTRVSDRDSDQEFCSDKIAPFRPQSRRVDSLNDGNASALADSGRLSGGGHFRGISGSWLVSWSLPLRMVGKRLLSNFTSVDARIPGVC